MHSAVLSSSLLPLLQSTFGHSSFRANQQAVCEAATDGRDVLLVMPTGAGKSTLLPTPCHRSRRNRPRHQPAHRPYGRPGREALRSRPPCRRASTPASPAMTPARPAATTSTGSLQFLFIAPERLRVPWLPRDASAPQARPDRHRRGPLHQRLGPRLFVPTTGRSASICPPCAQPL